MAFFSRNTKFRWKASSGGSETKASSSDARQSSNSGSTATPYAGSSGCEKEHEDMDIRSDSAFDGLNKLDDMTCTNSDSAASSGSCVTAELPAEESHLAGAAKGQLQAAQPGTPALGPQSRPAYSPTDSGQTLGSSPHSRHSRSRESSASASQQSSGAAQQLQQQQQQRQQRQYQQQRPPAPQPAFGSGYCQSTEPLSNHERYYKLRDLNRGAHGFVQLALDMETGEQVAIKFLDRSVGKMKTKHILRELLNQRLCAQHPHIVHLREAFLTPGHLGISMEYATSGDLLDYVEAHMAHGMMVPEADARLLFQQLMVAVDYCHRLGIVNRDIKLDNILLHGDAPAILKLCDFGYSKDGAVESDCKTACGTPEYMAPEVLKGEAYDGKAVDVWSCGCSLYILLCGDYPFRTAGHNQAQTPIKRMQAMFPRLVAGQYNPLRPEASAEVRDIIHRMLNPDPKNRITVPEIMAHPWFMTDLPAGVTDLNETLLATAAAAEVDAYDASACGALAMSPEEVWRTRGVDGCNRQSIAQLVALVEAAAQQPPSGDLPWSPPRLNVHAH